MNHLNSEKLASQDEFTILNGAKEGKGSVIMRLSDLNKEKKLIKKELSRIDKQIENDKEKRKRVRRSIRKWSSFSRNSYIKNLYNTDYDQKHGITVVYNVPFTNNQPRYAFKKICDHIRKEFPQVYGYWVLQPRKRDGLPHFHLSIFVKEPSDAFSIKKLGNEVKQLWRSLLGIAKYSKANNISIDEDVETDYLDYTTKNDEEFYDKSRLPRHLRRFWSKGRRCGYINEKLARINQATYEYYCVNEEIFEEFKAYASSQVNVKIVECKEKGINCDRQEDYKRRIEEGRDLFMAYLTDEQVAEFRNIVSKGHKVILNS